MTATPRSNRFVMMTASVLLATSSVAGWAQVQQPQLVAAMDSGGGSVQFIDPAGAGVFFEPYGAAFTGGVRVAVGDVTGDGVPDVITGSGPGIEATVRIFNGLGLDPDGGVTAYPGYLGGVIVAVGDVNADGVADLITGPGHESDPVVKVFDSRSGTELRSFFAYEAGFRGGVRVAAGDVNGDGHADIITAPGSGGGPHVKVFDGRTGGELHSFQPFATSFAGGIYVATGDFDLDGMDDLAVASGDDPVAGAGGGPRVIVFTGLELMVLADFFPYGSSFTGGVRVATGDLNGDGRADIITTPGPGGAPQLTRWLAPDASNGGTLPVFTPSFTGGVFVAATVVTPTILRDSFE